MGWIGLRTLADGPEWVNGTTPQAHRPPVTGRTHMLSRMSGWVAAISLVVASGAGCGTAPGSDSVSLSFRTEDGFGLRADLSFPAATDADAAPLVLLAHDLEGNRRSWDPLIGALLDRGCAALAVDLRGFGESTGEAASRGAR